MDLGQTRQSDATARAQDCPVAGFVQSDILSLDHVRLVLSFLHFPGSPPPAVLAVLDTPFTTQYKLIVRNFSDGTFDISLGII